MGASSETGEHPVVEVEFGTSPGFRIWGLLGGLALIVAGVALIVYLGRRASFKIGGALTVFGLILLWRSGRVKGAQISAQGTRLWTYTGWFFGGERFVLPRDIHSIALGDNKGKFTMILHLRDGQSHTLPNEWAAIKDAQHYIDQTAKMYGVGAGAEITDEKLLREAAELLKAERFFVVPRYSTRADGERLLFEQDDAPMGEVRVLNGIFQGSKAEIADGPGGLDSNGPRWRLQKSFWGGLSVKDGAIDAGKIAVSKAFTGQRCELQWTDPQKKAWSAVFTSDESDRDPFSMKLYFGLPEGLGKRGARERMAGQQGEAVLMAVVDGPANAFTVDVADERVWPWVRLALAAIWLERRPDFKFSGE